MSTRALINACRRTLLSNFSPRHRANHTSTISPNPPSKTSPIESNMLRILRNELRYQIEYAPPHEPVSTFSSFDIEHRPGEQWITLHRPPLTNQDECIKIEATMFDGSAVVTNSGEETLQLHVSVLVDIWKGGEEGGKDGDKMEFVCSAWPDRLEIQKVYIFRKEGCIGMPYMGPDVKKMNVGMREGLYGFLKTRGVDDGLSVFLHEYMMNKDRIELIQWLKNVLTCVAGK